MNLYTRTWSLIACALLATSANAAVYKHIDENGQVSYSDKPVEGSKKIKIRAQRHHSAQQVPERNQPEPQTGAALAASPDQTQYTAMEILTPKNDQFTENISGDVDVMLMTTPRLAASDNIVITLNGNEIANGRQASAALTQVPRGTHTVSASIISADGAVLITAPAVSFHVKRPVVDRTSPLAFDRKEEKKE